MVILMVRDRVQLPLASYQGKLIVMAEGIFMFFITLSDTLCPQCDPKINNPIYTVESKQKKQNIAVFLINFEQT
jgi:hypothetical protein